MNALPAPSLPRAILSFDFDGTMHHRASDTPVPDVLFEEIRRVRREYNALWGINTGRSLAHMIEGFEESRFPFLPDWVVARECEIYTPEGSRQWNPHEHWNQRMHEETGALFDRAEALLTQIRQEVEQHTGASWMDAEGEPAGLIALTLEEMEWIMARVIALAGDHPELAWQRNSIYLRFCHRKYHKGSCLAEVAHRHGVPAARCFAIGDGHNDLEMLHGDHAGMIACPANAVSDIQEAVRSGGGWIAPLAYGYGTAEALRHYFPPLG